MKASLAFIEVGQIKQHTHEASLSSSGFSHNPSHEDFSLLFFLFIFKCFILSAVVKVTEA